MRNWYSALDTALVSDLIFLFNRLSADNMR